MARQTHIPCGCQLITSLHSSLCSCPTSRGTSGSHLAVTSLVLQTQIWHCVQVLQLRISLPGSQTWPHSGSHSCSCYFTHVKYWQFCFLARTLKLHLLFHCLNHWNEYTTQPKNSCLREAAATKPCPTVTRYRDPGSGSSTAINCLLTHWTKLYFKKMCSAGQSRKSQARMHFIPQRCIIKEGLQICVGTALTPY